MVKQIIIDGVIGTREGEISSSAFRAALPDDGQPIEVLIHSEGGSVFEGFRIYDLLKEYAGPKKAIIQSSAFSIASFIPMACDEIEITPNGFLMVHNPYTSAEGDDEELAKTAGLMSQLKDKMIQAYSTRSGRSTAEIAGLLKQETFLDAQQCIAFGFADRITETPVVGRMLNTVNEMPHGVVSALFGAVAGGNKVESQSMEQPMSESNKPVAASVNEIEAAFPKMKPTTILACLKKQMPMAQVAQAAMEETMTENDALAARCQELEAKFAAMEQELMGMRAKAMEEEETVAPAPAQPEEETVARAAGVPPLAKSRTSSQTATVKWNEEIQARVAKGMTKAQAALAVDREYPDLRSRFVAEYSANRVR